MFTAAGPEVMPHFLDTNILLYSISRNPADAVKRDTDAAFTAGAPGDSAAIGEGAASAEADRRAAVAAGAGELVGGTAYTAGTPGDGAAVGEGAASAKALFMSKSPKSFKCTHLFDFAT